MRRSTATARRESLRQLKKKKRKKIDDDSDWELEDHVSSYDSDDSDNVALWTSNADNVDGESDGSDYELGSLLKKKPLAKRKKAKKKDGLRCNECLNSQKAYDPEEGSKVRSLVTKYFFVVKVYFHLSNSSDLSLCHFYFSVIASLGYHYNGRLGGDSYRVGIPGWKNETMLQRTNFN